MVIIAADHLPEYQRTAVSSTSVRLSVRNSIPLSDMLSSSKAHFQQALAVIQPAGPTAGGTSTPVNDSHSDESQPKPRKIYPCPHPGCRNQYKQLSGLRYHLARVRLHSVCARIMLTYSQGHPTELPVQLDIVPPSLARKVAEKQRRRDSSAAVDTCTA